MSQHFSTFVLEVITNAIRQDTDLKKEIVLIYRLHDHLQKIWKDWKKSWKLINDHSKVAGSKVDIQKSTLFLYTSNKQVESEIKNTRPFILAFPNELLTYKSKIYVQDLYKETKKRLWKGIKKELNKWRYISYSQIEDSLLSRCQLFLMYTFNVIPIKLQQIISWILTNWF